MNQYKAQFARRDRRAHARRRAATAPTCSSALSARRHRHGRHAARRWPSDPIVFALANPDPEISYPRRRRPRGPTSIMATGRSDYPNQVNNVLGFPFIFRGALDVRATRDQRGDEAARPSQALAALAREDVPDSVLEGLRRRSRSGSAATTSSPSRSTPRVLLWVAPAVAEAAMDSGVARAADQDLDAYRGGSRRMLGALARGHARRHRARRSARPEAHRVPRGRAPEDPARREDPGRGGHRQPDPARRERGDREKLDASSSCRRTRSTIIDTTSRAEAAEQYARRSDELRQREGHDARGRARAGCATRNVLRRDDGRARATPTAWSRGLTAVLPRHDPPGAPDLRHARPACSGSSGMYMLVLKDRRSSSPTRRSTSTRRPRSWPRSRSQTADAARRFDIEPRVAMLSFSNFGSARTPRRRRSRDAVELVRAARARTSRSTARCRRTRRSCRRCSRTSYPVARPSGAGRTCSIFPDLEAANIAYKLSGAWRAPRRSARSSSA